MNNLVKKSLYASAGTALVALNSVNSVLAAPAGTFGGAAIIEPKIETTSLPETIQNYVSYLMGFLYLIAVLYALWGGFQILTAGGDDEKVSKGKTILIQGATGLFVIWIAGTLVKFILSILAN